MKVCGIFLVVYGHSLAVPGWLYKIIYSFHIPLFFFISGLLFKKERLESNFRDYGSFLFQSLVRPYFFFSAVGFLAWSLVFRTQHGEGRPEVALWKPLLGLFYGSGVDIEALQPIVLWFFPCLVSVYLLVYGLERLPKSKLVLLFLLALFGFSGCPWILPWGLNAAAVASGFFYAGMWIREVEGGEERLRKFPLVYCTVLAVFGCLVASMNAGVDMRSLNYGNPLLFYLASGSFILVLFRLSLLLPGMPLVEAISRSTRTIFPLHPLVFSLLTGVYVIGLKMPRNFRYNGFVGFFATAFILIVLTRIHPCVEKCFEGRRQTDAARLPRRENVLK
jgi:acyltransferase